MTDVRDQLRHFAARNRELHALLPHLDEHVMPDDDTLANLEMVALEIEANARTMEALLMELEQ